jgi:hypothetical protein
MNMTFLLLSLSRQFWSEKKHETFGELAYSPAKLAKWRDSTALGTVLLDASSVVQLISGILPSYKSLRKVVG